MPGRTMPYRALWCRNDEIVAERHFADLIQAKQYVLNNVKVLFRENRATNVKVVGKGRVAFSIDVSSSQIR